MSESEPADNPGYRVTLKDVDEKVNQILARLPDDAHVRLRKLEAQVAAQWVVVGIVILALGGLFSASLTNAI